MGLDGRIVYNIPLIVNDAGVLLGYRDSNGVDRSLFEGLVIDGFSSDALPPQTKAVSATGQVVASPCKVVTIRCISGTTPSITLRDSVVQTAAGTDTTSPVLFTATMAAGDVLRLDLPASFGLHATLGGTSPVFELEF